VADEIKEKASIKSFPKNYWVVILMEFFERGSYYGVMSVLSVYLVLNVDKGGLGFTKESVGIIKSVITPLLYFLPILSGAIADRFGYRKMLMFSFSVMSIGYLLTGLASSYALVFLSLLLMVIGAGSFKPVISGTIARTTNESNSTLGFGIYYWSINLGAFIFPLILIPWLKEISWSYIFFMAAIGTGSLFFLNLFVYKEPKREKSTKNIGEVFVGMFKVLADWRFILMIVIYSGFWILYFQMFDTVLWYLKDHMDMTPVDKFVNGFLGIFVNNPNWKFDAEHVTVINAGTIILLQLVVSSIVKNTKALPTMIVGIALGVVALAFVLFCVQYSPGPPRYALDSQSLAIRDLFYPVTVRAADVDVERVRVVDWAADADWRPTARTNGFANSHYRSGWFRVANGEKVRMYRADGTRLVLIPARDAAVLLEVQDPERFVEELRRLWARP